MPTNNAKGVAFYCSGCLKWFCLLWWVEDPPYNVFCRYGGQGCPPINPSLRLEWWVGNPPYNQACGLVVGRNAHPMALLCFCRVGNLLPTRFNHIFRLPETIFYRYIVFCRYGGLKTHPTTKPAAWRWAGKPTLRRFRLPEKSSL